MGVILEGWIELKAAFGTRWYFLGTAFAAIVSQYDRIARILEGRGMRQLIGVPDWLVGIVIFSLWTALTAIWHAVKLRRQITPKFEISFERHGQGIAQAVERGVMKDSAGKDVPFEFRANYIRATANVISKIAVKDCFAVITKVQCGPIQGMGQFVEIPLPQPVLVTERPISIFPQMPNHFDFAVASERFGLRVVRNWPFALERAFEKVATYRFLIAIYGEGGNQAKDIRVDVHWNGDWKTVTASQVS